MEIIMYTVSHLRGTAPASLVVIQGMGRALNPTKRSKKPQNTNLSAHNYDDKNARHRNGVAANDVRTEAFDTPVQVYRKVTGWMTVSGGKNGLSVTYAPDAMVVFASVEIKNKETGEVETITVQNITLKEYQDTYC